MKAILFIRLVCLAALAITVSGCIAARGGFYGVGPYNPRGVPEGEWTLYRYEGHPILGKGRLLNGEPHGNWTLWDQGGFKVAELSFSNGKLNGEYRFFYSSHTPQAQNRLKTVGHQVMGQSIGVFERYLPDGKLLVKYRLMEEGKYQVLYGAWQDVAVQSEADKELLRINENAIRSAIKHPARMPGPPVSLR